MKTNIEIKNEPNEIQVKDFFYDYNQIKKFKINSTNNSITNKFVNQEQELSICIWCQKLGSKSFTLYNDNDGSKRLCSEICFNQYRRASFKKNKDKKLLKTYQTIKIRSTNCSISDKISKSIISENEHNHQRKILSSYPHSSSKITKINTNEISRRLSPLSSSSSRFLPPTSTNLNHFQYPFVTIPSVQQLPSSLPLRTTSSTLFPISTNYTCILPSFIPLPIPIPFYFPIHLSNAQFSTNIINQECQTEIRNNINSCPINQEQQQKIRRISI
ncbi:unnamed protein product [Rotaria sordida]|uniref:Uncharacterized protein n=1 Tax=Rotaria sordida TaxID=392033 RepID=A0A819K4R9_9BILA|nr:unnamed protein product [Rotaria sordida]CAF3943728.1 unnamed protein product [Rotaria sordida]